MRRAARFDFSQFCSLLRSSTVVSMRGFELNKGSYDPDDMQDVFYVNTHIQGRHQQVRGPIGSTFAVSHSVAYAEIFDKTSSHNDRNR